MTVFPDGEALSDWESEVLHDIEHDLELTDPQLVALLFQGDPAPLYDLASLVAAEAAVAFAVVSVFMAATMMGLAAIGTALWATSAPVRELRRRAAHSEER